MTRDDWQAINPASIIAAQYEGAYIASFTVDGVKKGFLIDPLNPTGIYWLDKGYDAMFFDELQDALFVLDGPSIKKWDAGAALTTAVFRSKVFRAYATNFGAARVIADGFPVTVKVDALGLDPTVVTKQVEARPGVLTSPNATTLRYTKVVADRRPFRLPAGFTATDWQVEVSSTNAVQQVVVASTMAELTDS